jgi:hypothetical protein
MIKFVMAALWIAAVTVGSVNYCFNIQQGTAEKPEPGFFGGLDYIRTDMNSVPLLRDRKVQGYFLARLVYTVEPAKLKKLSLPAETLLMDRLELRPVGAQLFALECLDGICHAKGSGRGPTAGC